MSTQTTNATITAGTQSPKFGLPLLAPAQARKHVTHNEAITRMEAAVQLSLRGVADAPPDDPADGEAWLAGASGLLGAGPGEILYRRGGAWDVMVPAAGWVAWRADLDALSVHDGTGWRAVTGGERLPRLGIGADADATNRLSVSSDATLLSHADGGSHRVAVNRAGTDDTASVVFQTGYAGDAEFGLNGADGFSLKVSTDGNAFRTALSADPATGTVNLPDGVRLGGGADVLDIYEEGAWVPELRGHAADGSPDYAVQAGSFVRVGALVHATFRVKWTGLGGLSGRVRVRGLPFAVAQGHHNRSAATALWYLGLAADADTTTVGGMLYAGTQEIWLWAATDPGQRNTQLLLHSDLSESGELYMSMTYRCAA